LARRFGTCYFAGEILVSGLKGKSMDLSRRLMLQLTALAGIRPLAGGAATGGGARPEEIHDPAIRRVFAQVIDTLIPDDEVSPGALAAGVDERMVIASEPLPEFRKLVVEGCRWLNQEAAGAGAATFTDLDQAGRDLVIGRMEEAPPDAMQRDFFERVRYGAFLFYYADPISLRGLGYAGPPQPDGFPDYAEPPVGRL